MSGSSAYVIAGAGLAGAKAAETLRGEGFDGPVVLIGDEAERPYERPPLSKDYLLGKAERETIYVHPESWYADNDVQLRLGVPVAGIDRAAHEVALADGTRIGYARLLLATGSSPRRLPVPGAGTDGVLYLRRVDDSDRIKATFQGASRIAVIGAGWIGLETAAAARAAGVEVTILEAAELPLLRVLGAEVARVFAGLHREQGVDLRFGVQVSEITNAGGRVTGVRLADGSQVQADAVIVGVGITPNTQLAEAAGLETGNGVVVDAALRSSDPDVFAAGDVARALHPLLGQHIRVEHWANALNQPQAAARAMLGQDVCLRQGPLLLHRPVRPGHGVRRLRRARPLRPGRLPRRRGRARVHRVLAGRRPGAGRHERQHLGRQRRDPGPGQRRPPGGPGPAGGPRRAIGRGGRLRLSCRLPAWELAAHHAPEPQDLGVPCVEHRLDDVHRGVHRGLQVAGNAVPEETASQRPPEPFRGDRQQIGRLFARLNGITGITGASLMRIRPSAARGRPRILTAGRRDHVGAVRHREQRRHRPRLRLSGRARGGAPPLW